MLWVPLLLLACAAAGLTCGRLCVAAARAATSEAPVPCGARLTLYEAAFLAGGPVRVADLTLVAMARARRLLIAHTGWATVVDPEGRDDIERSVLSAIGRDGQSTVAPVRRGAATAAPCGRSRTGSPTPGSPFPGARARAWRPGCARCGPRRSRCSRSAPRRCCCRGGSPRPRDRCRSPCGSRCRCCARAAC
ncbi:hypothetical protein SALBM135S_02266 [Streptomyces alboniger]